MISLSEITEQEQRVIKSNTTSDKQKIQKKAKAGRGRRTVAPQKKLVWGQEFIYGQLFDHLSGWNLQLVHNFMIKFEI